jgi:hypothetical protein
MPPSPRRLDEADDDPELSPCSRAAPESALLDAEEDPTTPATGVFAPDRSHPKRLSCPLRGGGGGAEMGGSVKEEDEDDDAPAPAPDMNEFPAPSDRAYR